MIDRDGEKTIADRRQSKFERHALGRFDDECFFGLDDLRATFDGI